MRRKQKQKQRSKKEKVNKEKRGEREGKKEHGGKRMCGLGRKAEKKTMDWKGKQTTRLWEKEGSPVTKVFSLPFYRQGNRVSERLSDLLKVTQLVNGEGKI